MNRAVAALRGPNGGRSLRPRRRLAWRLALAGAVVLGGGGLAGGLALSGDASPTLAAAPAAESAHLPPAPPPLQAPANWPKAKREAFDAQIARLERLKAEHLPVTAPAPPPPGTPMMPVEVSGIFNQPDNCGPYSRPAGPIRFLSANDWSGDVGHDFVMVCAGTVPFDTNWGTVGTPGQAAGHAAVAMVLQPDQATLDRLGQSAWWMRAGGVFLAPGHPEGNLRVVGVEPGNQVVVELVGTSQRWRFNPSTKRFSPLPS
jgi:hypothetical protein